MPSPLRIFVVASDNTNKQYDNVCSALKGHGHHIGVWDSTPNDDYDPWLNFITMCESLNKLSMRGVKYSPSLISNEDLSKATMEASWADMLLLVGFGRDACFLAGAAHVSGVRSVVFDKYPIGLDNSLIAGSVSFWCRTIEDVVELANNWEDPIPEPEDR